MKSFPSLALAVFLTSAALGLAAPVPQDSGSSQHASASSVASHFPFMDSGAPSIGSSVFTGLKESGFAHPHGHPARGPMTTVPKRDDAPELTSVIEALRNATDFVEQDSMPKSLALRDPAPAKPTGKTLPVGSVASQNAVHLTAEQKAAYWQNAAEGKEGSR